ncbi:MAG: nucleotidyl transferase AbiEii/AbiGii toxin family protein [Bacteroidales bacterium]
MINPEYKERVRLLLRIIPIVSDEECFAIHGGTAINLFIQNLPRYSVDIDLTYIPVEPRDESLKKIKTSLNTIKSKIIKSIPGIRVDEKPNKLMCSLNGSLVKIEVNDVKRGIVSEPTTMTLCELAQEEFGVFCKARIVPLTQLYGGKITAALDRQHPRDLFDVKLMFDYVKDFEEIKYGFIFCLLGSDRPLFESLNPNLNNQRDALNNQFEGMSSIPFTYSEYEQTRLILIEYINSNLSKRDKEFLVSFEDGEPQWEESDYCNFENYPSIQWKQLNILKLKSHNPDKHKQGVEKLKQLWRI